MENQIININSSSALFQELALIIPKDVQLIEFISNGNSLVESTSVFIESTGFIDEHFTPTLHVRESVSDHWYSESYILDALSSTVDGNVPLFSTIIRSSSTVSYTHLTLPTSDLV